MRILQVNKFYYLRGGAEKYLLAISQALEEQGHKVAIFAMEHPRNLPSPHTKYFVSRVSFSEPGLGNKLKAGRRIFWSREAARKFEKLIKDFRPDVIHFHNIYHHLSPSILKIAKRYQIPMIMHLHDYKLICPNYQLFTQGKYCERCRDRNYSHCTEYRCLKDSYAKSLLASLEMFYHHSWLKIYEKDLDRLIAPSRFIKDTFVRFGWPETKISQIYNFSEKKYLEAPLKPAGDYLLYLGRLAPEKGLSLLFEALKESGHKLKIAGEGPERKELETLVKTLILKDQIEFVGFKSGSDLENLIAGAKAIVIPSIWPENMPFSLLEAMARGKAVIAAKVGGLSELIKDKENGFSFTAGSSASLRAAIDQLDHSDLETIGLKAREAVAGLELGNHLSRILAIYKELIAKKQAVR